MLHRKRFRLATVVILTLLLTIALASLAAAQDAGNGNPPKPGTPTPEPTATRALPDKTGGEGMNGDGNGMNGDGNGMNGNGNGNGNGMNGGMMGSRPGSNSIVLHPATPIQLVAAGDGGLHCYFIAPDGATRTGPVIESFSDLEEMHPSGGAVTLFSGSNPGSGKPVMILYLPAEKKIRVSTYYPDSPPYDYNKPYVFTVDADHSVTHNSW